MQTKQSESLLYPLPCTYIVSNVTKWQFVFNDSWIFPEKGGEATVSHAKWAGYGTKLEEEYKKCHK